jgi:hypothetical protein
VCRRPNAGNVFQNPGFDTSLSGWDPTGVTWDSEDSEGCAGSGSAYIANSEFALDQCVQLASNTSYFFGAKLKGASSEDFCVIEFYSGANCDLNTDLNVQAQIQGLGVQGWTLLSTGLQTPAGTKSGYFYCALTGVKVDEVYVNPTYNQF